jgi:hypothetical protein
VEWVPICLDGVRNAGEKNAPELLDEVHQIQWLSGLLILMTLATAGAIPSVVLSFTGTEVVGSSSEGDRGIDHDASHLSRCTWSPKNKTHPAGWRESRGIFNPGRPEQFVAMTNTSCMTARVHLSSSTMSSNRWPIRDSSGTLDWLDRAVSTTRIGNIPSGNWSPT